MNPSPHRQRLRFGPFVLDTHRMELQRDGVPVPLRPKPFALLVALANRPGTVLRKAELFSEVWPGVVVSDDSLTQAVREVRAALGDSGASLLRTVARQGYRFDAEVADADALPAPGAAPQGAVAAAAPTRWGRWRVAWRSASVPLRVGVLGSALAVLAAALLPRDAWVAVVPAGVASLVAGPSGDAAVAAAPRLSLVVLPLEVEAGSDGGEAFSDPLTLDLTASLGKVSGLFVISRETAFSYRGRRPDPRTVARELNVRYVVRGSVKRSDQAVRLDMSLVDGATGQVRWAERFELDRAQLRQALPEVAAVLSRSLGVEVYRAEGQRAATLRPDQVQADDLAMQGWALWLRGLSRENTLEALHRFDQAVARDPDSLRGWAGVAMMNAQAANLGWAADPAPARARQREALQQMERIDSEDMLTLFARVDPYYRRQDFAGLLQLAQTLVARFPNQPWSHHQQASALMRLGRFDECIAPARQALRLGPRDTLRVLVRGMASFCHAAAGRHAEALAEARRAVQDSPTEALAQLMLAAALAQAGEAEAARQVVQEYQGKATFRQETLRRLLAGPDPGLAQARERLFRTLGTLGVP